MDSLDASARRNVDNRPCPGTEFTLAAESNSGVYLRGRYEVQVLADFGKPPDVHGMGAIYGFVVPAIKARQ